MISSTYKPMTEKQLKDVVSQYASVFPDWQMFLDGTAFIRRNGPIQQMIWFQKMNYAAYRPTHAISALPLPAAGMLSQTLDVKHRETEYRWHERKWQGVVAAMEQQFKPNIRKPLDMADVLALCEAEARPDATNDLAMLAILFAWLGRDAEARDACARMQSAPLPGLAPMPEWEAKMKAFGRKLADAVEAGVGRDFLQEAIEKHSTVC